MKLDRITDGNLTRDILNQELEAGSNVLDEERQLLT
jgi:hypothetical protein